MHTHHQIELPRRSERRVPPARLLRFLSFPGLSARRAAQHKRAPGRGSLRLGASRHRQTASIVGRRHEPESRPTPTRPIGNDQGFVVRPHPLLPWHERARRSSVAAPLQAGCAQIPANLRRWPAALMWRPRPPHSRPHRRRTDGRRIGQRGAHPANRHARGGFAAGGAAA